MHAYIHDIALAHACVLAQVVLPHMRIHTCKCKYTQTHALMPSHTYMPEAGRGKGRRGGDIEFNA